jgi:hypothetical protein
VENVCVKEAKRSRKGELFMTDKAVPHITPVQVRARRKGREYCKDVKNEALEQAGPQASNLTPLWYFLEEGEKLLLQELHHPDGNSSGIFGE